MWARCLAGKEWLNLGLGLTAELDGRNTEQVQGLTLYPSDYITKDAYNPPV